ncbi:hypothetical protein FisN_24Lh162 [Fistulifera solaris]|uniref:Protein ENHANCED DISEASE RESISTANCE 2 C-terminal domain-containing protein n=1 Tax=Fistulifera solaris TaxID=1519565 RepID=A0A1Z5K9P3_FISSO|nr:hypothetical protein FisN_24Lh162 [Fistulifera solaris]|eukprot:GAX22875.1 hypothetical protein FisN_24Lh162 [Fistulifera solaris]
MVATAGKDTPNPLQIALEKSQVKAQVVACDHYRIHGGLAVESDFIVLVYPKEPELFASFALSKTYSAFRSLAHQLEQVVQNSSHKEQNLADPCDKALKYARLVSQLIDSQRTQYLGKVNFMYVKLLAKERQRIIDSVLDATVRSFPLPEDVEKYEVVAKVATIVRTFFLTDHCCEVDAEALLKEGAAIPDELRHQRQVLSIRSASHKVIQQVPDTILAPLAWLGDGVKKVASNFPKRDESSVGEPPSIGGSVIVPMSYKRRRSQLQRESDEVELATIAGEQARLLLDDDRHPAELVPSYAQPGPVVRADTTELGKMIDNNPMIFAAIAMAAIRILMKAAQIQVHLDADIALLIVFAAFCMGLHTPRPLVGGFDRPPSMIAVVKQNETIQHDKSGRELLSRAMTQQKLTSDSTDIAMNETESNLKTTPMTKLPAGSPPVGSYINKWSDPDPSDFEVRGPNYLSDKKKIGSAEYLFPSRGLELLLTDTCPEHVALNPRIFGGNLRDVPTFVINFRLPWGVLLFYFEIPDRFLPFVCAGFESISEEEKKRLSNTLDSMSPPERAVGRFLMNDEKHKNESLKILPVVIDGPWVVRQVVGGKPAIIGNKLPVKYHYGAASSERSLYLEADLDIAASSAARGILSVARSYTQILTLNLGFVVQGNKEDELPEQMLVGMRLHGIDPLTAPAYPTLLPHNDNDALLEQVDSDGGESCT